MYWMEMGGMDSVSATSVDCKLQHRVVFHLRRTGAGSKVTRIVLCCVVVQY